MRLAGSCSADQHAITLLLEEAAAGEIARQPFIDRRAFEGEVVDLHGLRKFGDRHLIFDRARVFFGDFRLEQIADNARRFMLPLDAGRHHLVVGRPHAEELEFSP